MARVRKTRGQQSLVFSKRGGARPGAGRPRKGKRASEPHKRRLAVKPSEPVHVTLRTVDGLPRLRTRSAYKAVREAAITMLRHDSCRIVHLSIQRNHVHLLVEADDRMALARGMQGFQISAAKHINAALGRRRGQVFADRYHPERITNRKQARHALAYVLKNASHCTLSGRRVEFPTCWAQTRLLQRAQRAVGYRRPRFEDFIWDRSALPWPGQVDFQARHGPGVPEQLKS